MKSEQEILVRVKELKKEYEKGKFTEYDYGFSDALLWVLEKIAIEKNRIIIDLKNNL